MIFSSSLDGTRGWGIDQLIVYIRYGSLFYKFSTGGYFAREVNEWLKVTKEFWWSWECCITPLECSILSPLFTCNPMERGGCLSLAGSFGHECVDKSVLVFCLLEKQATLFLLIGVVVQPLYMVLVILVYGCGLGCFPALVPVAGETSFCSKRWQIWVISKKGKDHLPRSQRLLSRSQLIM